MKNTPKVIMERYEQLALTSPDSAAKKIINGIKNNKQRIIVGIDAYVMDWLTRLFPVQFVRFMGFCFSRV